MTANHVLGIRAVLADYTRAFESKDAALLQRLRPGLTAEELRSYREIWDAVSVFKVTLKVDRIDVSGDEADVTGRREDVMIYKDGRREPGGRERPFKFKLKRARDTWAIEAVN